MKKLSIGPFVLNQPSWAWCATDLIDLLKTNFEVRTFTYYEELKAQDPDTTFVVKQPPLGKEEIPARSKLVYLPVDFFESCEHIASFSNFLERCNAILVHSQRMIKFLKNYCQQITFVEHYGKYVLPEMREFMSEGFVVWVGFREYVPMIRNWYCETPRSFALKIATNCRSNLVNEKSFGLQQYQWNEEIQRQLFKEAKAGLDLKNNSFRQSTKPPTKIQQFVASGIPPAINSDSYSWEYFHSKGFDLSTPNDLTRWFSHDYWQETKEMGLLLRTEITKEKVAGSYLKILNNLPMTSSTLSVKPQSFLPFSRTGRFIHHDIPPTKETIEFVSRRIPQFEINPSDAHVLAIQSCNRPKHNSLEKTLESLVRAGHLEWRGPKLIVTDGYFPSIPHSWILDADPSPPVGSSKTFMRLLRSSLQIAPNLSRLTYLQDDVSFSKNALTYIDHIKIDDDVSFITWFSYWKNWRGAGNDSLPLLELGQGASFYANQAVTFPRKTVDLLLDALENNRWEWRNASDRICAVFLKDSLFEAHYPVLVQHTESTNSACSPACLRERKSTEFAGEDFDTLSLIK